MEIIANSDVNSSERSSEENVVNEQSTDIGSKAWVALGKSFHLCRLKNHKNSKPQPEKKTFSPTEEGRISGS